MKKLLILCVLILAGCTENQRARQFGGNEVVKIEPGHKLVNATWKAHDLWYLTRPARDGEKPEVYKFQEKSSFGIIEGTVTFHEQGK